MTTTMIVEDKRPTRNAVHFTPAGGIDAIQGIVLL
jgi:hypothetical protein